MMLAELFGRGLRRSVFNEAVEEMFGSGSSAGVWEGTADNGYGVFWLINTIGALPPEWYVRQEGSGEELPIVWLARQMREFGETILQRHAAVQQDKIEEEDEVPPGGGGVGGAAGAQPHIIENAGVRINTQTGEMSRPNGARSSSPAAASWSGGGEGSVQPDGGGHQIIEDGIPNKNRGRLSVQPRKYNPDENIPVSRGSVPMGHSGD